MMRGHVSALPIVFVLLTALLGPGQVTQSARAADATPVPAGSTDVGRFRAVFVGFGVPAENGRCPALTVVIAGPGSATHLGNFETTQDQCVDPTGDEPLAFTDGRYTFTARDGSTITGRYNGRMVPTETTASDDLYLIDGRFTIETGTGRFTGATGSGIADGLQNLTTGEASVVLDGTISYPGDGADSAGVGPVNPVR
jgi:hypothetical protein